MIYFLDKGAPQSAFQLPDSVLIHQLDECALLFKTFLKDIEVNPNVNLVTSDKYNLPTLGTGTADYELVEWLTNRNNLAWLYQYEQHVWRELTIRGLEIDMDFGYDAEIITQKHLDIKDAITQYDNEGDADHATPPPRSYFEIQMERFAPKQFESVMELCRHVIIHTEHIDKEYSIRDKPEWLPGGAVPLLDPEPTDKIVYPEITVSNHSAPEGSMTIDPEIMGKLTKSVTDKIVEDWNLAVQEIMEDLPY